MKIISVLVFLSGLILSELSQAQTTVDWPSEQHGPIPPACRLVNPVTVTGVAYRTLTYSNLDVVSCSYRSISYSKTDAEILNACLGAIKNFGFDPIGRLDCQANKIVSDTEIRFDCSFPDCNS